MHYDITKLHEPLDFKNWTAKEKRNAREHWKTFANNVSIKQDRDYAAATRIFECAEYDLTEALRIHVEIKQQCADDLGIDVRSFNRHVAKHGVRIAFYSAGLYGVMVSLKTRVPSVTKWLRAYPKRKDVASEEDLYVNALSYVLNEDEL